MGGIFIKMPHRIVRMGVTVTVRVYVRGECTCTEILKGLIKKKSRERQKGRALEGGGRRHIQPEL